MHAQRLPVHTPPMLLLHTLKPRLALARHQVNRLLHLILPSESQVLRVPILEIESCHQRKGNCQN
jgi:hypothetical protein